MMGKRYYCDFCNKSFADNATNRRNHMRGVFHRQLKREHYDHFQDASTRLKENFGKNPCRKYFNDGSCSFGALCMYSHITPDERKKLELEAQKESERKRGKTQPAAKVSSDKEIQDWLRACKKRLSEDDKSSEKNSQVKPPKLQDVFPTYELPDCLKGRATIPPSLLPPEPEDLQHVVIDGWG